MSTGPPPDHDRGRGDRRGTPSDLIGIEVTLAVAVAFLAILGAFFFIGPVVGIIVLLVVVAIGITALVVAIRRAEEGPGQQG